MYHKVGPLALLPVKVMMYHKVGLLALLLLLVTYKTSQSGRSLGKKIYFLVICPVSGIHQLLTLLMTSSLNASPALSNKESLIGNP